MNEIKFMVLKDKLEEMRKLIEQKLEEAKAEVEKAMVENKK